MEVGVNENCKICKVQKSYVTGTVQFGDVEEQYLDKGQTTNRHLLFGIGRRIYKNMLIEGQINEVPTEEETPGFCRYIFEDGSYQIGWFLKDGEKDICHMMRHGYVKEFSVDGEMISEGLYQYDQLIKTNRKGEDLEVDDLICENFVEDKYMLKA